MDPCITQESLRAEVHAILAEIDRLNDESMKALSDWDDRRLMSLGKELELLTGKKERAYGALFHHRKEHGC